MNKDELYYWALETLQGLISTPRISREEGEAVDYFAQQLQQIGITTRREGNNLIATSADFSDKKPTILLNSHIDTVKASGNWTTDPFTPTLIDEQLFGIGSNDAGASLVALAATFAYLTQKEQSYNLIFVQSCQEEVSGHEGMEKVRDQLPPISFAIIGEPTCMQPAIAEKGLLVLDCEVKGRQGHAARNEGENAILKALPIIQQLNNYSFPLQSELVGGVKCSVTMIHAGTQHNVVPDSCQFVVDIRSNEHYTNEEIFHTLEKALPECHMKARSFRLNSSRIDPHHPFVERCRLLDLQPYGSPTMSDQTFLRCPSLKMGVGDSARSHTANEYIHLSELREGIELYIKLLDQFNP